MELENSEKRGSYFDTYNGGSVAYRLPSSRYQSYRDLLLPMSQSHYSHSTLNNSKTDSDDDPQPESDKSILDAYAPLHTLSEEKSPPIDAYVPMDSTPIDESLPEPTEIPLIINSEDSIIAKNVLLAKEIGINLYRYEITLIVIEIRNVIHKSKDSLNLYANINCSHGPHRKTAAIGRSSSPHWNASFQYLISVDPQKVSFNVEIKSEQKYINEVLGAVKLDVSKLPINDVSDDWYPVLKSEKDIEARAELHIVIRIRQVLSNLTFYIRPKMIVINKFQITDYSNKPLLMIDVMESSNDLFIKDINETVLVEMRRTKKNSYDILDKHNDKKSFSISWSSSKGRKRIFTIEDYLESILVASVLTESSHILYKEKDSVVVGSLRRVQTTPNDARYELEVSLFNDNSLAILATLVIICRLLNKSK